MSDSISSWGYFKQNGTWWRIEDGKVEQVSTRVLIHPPPPFFFPSPACLLTLLILLLLLLQTTESIALHDQRGSSEGRGVYYVIYSNPNPTGYLANLPQLNQLFQIAVDTDNQLLESEIHALKNGDIQSQTQLTPPSLPPRPVLSQTNQN